MRKLKAENDKKRSKEEHDEGQGAILPAKTEAKDLANRITQVQAELVYLLKQDQDSYEKIKHYQTYCSKLQEMVKAAEEAAKTSKREPDENLKAGVEIRA